MAEERMSLEEAHKIHRRFKILVGATIITLGTGTAVMHWLEKLSWVDSFYFSVVSLATVGYGDIVPKTDEGKLFVSFYLLLGIGILAAFVNNLVRGAVARHVIHKAETKS